MSEKKEGKQPSSAQQQEWRVLRFTKGRREINTLQIILNYK
jgi:hypothetical protein